MVIEKIFLLAMQIPDFSHHHGTTREEIIARILHLDIAESVRPARPDLSGDGPGPRQDDFGEPATYVSDEGQSYEIEHLDVFRPLARLGDLVRRIGVGVAQAHGAVG